MSIPDSSLGATITSDGVRFAVWSGAAKKVLVCLFDEQGTTETHRIPLTKRRGGLFEAHLPGIREGRRYGLRADGDYAPDKGVWFDPDKLLVDPYAVEIDRPFRFDARLAAPRGQGGDTASLMPKAIAKSLPEVIHSTPVFRPGGLIYELQVKAFTQLHPHVPRELRGTVAGLAHPAIVAHLKKLRVSAVELMPITAWMDERHLQPLGLTNSWGYNPATFMALDPRFCPGGMTELRDTVAALRAEGIGVILDLVFNHTAEGDRHGPTLSLRGLDANAYYRRHGRRLVNDTGTGNTVACDHPAARRLILDSLRHFVRHAGVDGFRFDLAPILGRDRHGFDANAALLRDMREDPILGDRVLIAEPWDIGPGGYQLGNFGSPWLEWNDRYRDDVRRFWRGERDMVGALATRLAGSSDIFRRDGQGTTRTVNFIAAHDGFALADLTAYERKHNQANGEKNRDGHNENFSWNSGAEGSTKDPAILAARARDRRALLATLFASRGTIMLTAGDEFGRTQQGNNNAYCQDNAVTWLDWSGSDVGLEDYVAALAGARFGLTSPPEATDIAPLSQTAFLTGEPPEHPDVAWLSETGQPMTEAEWRDPERRRLAMVLAGMDGQRSAVLVNGDRRAIAFALPEAANTVWKDAVTGLTEPGGVLVEARSVRILQEAASR